MRLRDLGVATTVLGSRSVATPEGVEVRWVESADSARSDDSRGSVQKKVSIVFVG